MSQVVVYELAVLYRVAPVAEVQATAKALKRQIGDVGGRVIKEDDWGQRELAYKIQNQTEATYVFYDVELPAPAVKELEAAFNITEGILRYQVYRPDLRALQKSLDHPQAQRVTEPDEAAPTETEDSKTKDAAAKDSKAEPESEAPKTKAKTEDSETETQSTKQAEEVKNGT